MNWKLLLLSNDLKRMYMDVKENFCPQLGMGIRGFTPDESEVKISGLYYDVTNKVFLINLSWTSIDVPESDILKKIGWSIYKKPTTAI